MSEDGESGLIPFDELPENVKDWIRGHNGNKLPPQGGHLLKREIARQAAEAAREKARETGERFGRKTSTDEFTQTFDPKPGKPPRTQPPTGK